MKNTIEAVAVGLVVLLSLGLISLVVRYNTIDTTENTQVDAQIMRSLQSNEVVETKEKKVNSYLSTLEAYTDVDVKVDPKMQPSNVNVATVETELNENGVVSNIGNAVQTVQKNENYVQNLEGYNPSQNVNTMQSTEQNVSEEAMPSEEESQLKEDPMSDIVNDIDSIVDDSEKAK